MIAFTFRFIVSVCLFSPFVLIHADDISSLYKGSVIYDEADTSISREMLIRQAFVKVIFKLTGDNQLDTLKERNEIIKSADKLVLKFSSTSFSPEEPLSFKDIDTVTDINDPMLPEPISEVSQPASSENMSSANEAPIDTTRHQYKKLHVTFNPVATAQFLKRYNLYPWSSIRPETLIWLSVELNNKRSILSPSQTPKVFNLLEQQAEDKGLTIQFPFADLMDTQRLSIKDLWDDFPDVILSASQRYHTPSILTSRIYKGVRDLWYANWSLYVINREIRWQSNAPDLDTLLKNGMTNLLFRLSNIFKIKDSERVDNQLNIKINNVTSYIDFQRLESYLKKVSVINNFKLKSITADSLLFEISFVGSKEHLLQNLAWGDVLQQLDKGSTKINSNKDESEQHFKAVDLIADNETSDSQNKQRFSYNAKDLNKDKKQNKQKLSDGKEINNEKPSNEKKQVLNLLEIEERVEQTTHFTEEPSDVEFWMRD